LSFDAEDEKRMLGTQNVKRVKKRAIFNNSGTSGTLNAMQNTKF
jgi:hypothetical protein